MAVSYVSKKCPSCASTKFIEDKISKSWVCTYCGTVIERHEEADTLYTIKNIVQQAILDVSYHRFDSAKKNIVECEKIDTRYIGTIIAKVCYYVNVLQFGNDNEFEKRNIFAQLKKYYSILSQNSDKLSEDEKALYEYFDSAEVFGTLILVYDTMGDELRRNFLYDKLNPQEIYSMDLNLNLLRFMINNNQIEIADKIVDNTDNIDQCKALQLLLDIYPDISEKSINCCKLIGNDVVSSDNRNIYENYIENSTDSFAVKYEIAKACCKTSAYPSVKCIMKNIVSNLEDVEKAKDIFEAIMSRKLLDVEIYDIVEFAFEKSNEKIALNIMQQLVTTKQFVTLNKDKYVTLLENKSISTLYKQKIIDASLAFNVATKVKEQFISYYINKVQDEKTDREVMIEYLLHLVEELSTDSVEEYIISNNFDGENKPKIVKMLMNDEINKSFYRETLDKYIMNNSDSVAVSDEIIEILIDAGLKISEESIVRLLLSDSFNEDKKINLFRRIKSTMPSYSSLADKYLFYTNLNNFSSNIFAEILDCTNSISVDSLKKYLFLIVDAESIKPINAKKLLEKCPVPVTDITCVINHLDATIECGVLQGYILASPDSYQVTMSLLNCIMDEKYKINTDILVSGIRYKFKKYLKEKKMQLSNTTFQVAQNFKLIQ